MARPPSEMLLGRKTYEALSAYWPKVSSDPAGFADLVNNIPTFVVSRTLQEPLTWNARLISGAVADQGTQLKRQHSGTLLSYGFVGLAHYLACSGRVAPCSPRRSPRLKSHAGAWRSRALRRWSSRSTSIWRAAQNGSSSCSTPAPRLVWYCPAGTLCRGRCRCRRGGAGWEPG